MSSMRRLELRALVAVMAAAWLIGCSCSPPRDDPDAPDAADTPDSPEDVPPDVPWPPSLAAHLEPGDRFESGCEPWDRVPEVPRGLPADPTPRVLWRWDPTGPAGIPDVFRPGTGPIAVGAGGHIYAVVGYESDVLVGLDANGARVWDETLGTLALGMPIALPDGGVAVMRERDSALLLFDDIGNLRQAERPMRSGAAMYGRFAVGPGGRIYALWSDGITALCQDGGRVWTLTFEAVGGNNIRVEADGSVIMEGNVGIGPLRISEEGELTEVPFPLRVGPTEMGWRQTVGSMSALAVASDRERTSSYFLAVASGDPWMIPSAPDYTHLGGVVVDASGGAVWVWNEIGPGPLRLRRYLGPNLLAFDRADLAFNPRVIEPAEDGSFVFVAADVERRMADDGRQAWSVDLGPGWGPQGGALMPNGVLYVGGTTGIFAVQTDALPTTVDYCGPQLGCNGRRDGAVRLFH